MTVLDYSDLQIINLETRQIIRNTDHLSYLVINIIYMDNGESWILKSIKRNNLMGYLGLYWRKRPINKSN